MLPFSCGAPATLRVLVRDRFLSTDTVAGLAPLPENCADPSCMGRIPGLPLPSDIVGGCPEVGNSATPVILTRGRKAAKEWIGGGDDGDNLSWPYSATYSPMEREQSWWPGSVSN